MVGPCDRWRTSLTDGQPLEATEGTTIDAKSLRLTVIPLSLLYEMLCDLVDTTLPN